MRYYWSILLVCSSIFTLLFSQGLKKTIFTGLPRPVKFFDETVTLHFIEGVKVHQYFTFPSGHTITAFMVFYLLSLMFNKRVFGTLFFIIALLVGVSRVYILQHFFIDIYFGAMLGMLSVIIPKYLIDSYFPKSLVQKIKRRSILQSYE